MRKAIPVGLAAGLLAVLLSACAHQITTECVQDPTTGAMKCTQSGEIVRL